MSLNLVNKTTGDLEKVAGNATDKVGNLSSLTTTDKSSVVAAINEVKSGLTSSPTGVNKNSDYVGYNRLKILRVGNLVNVSGRFEVTTTKPAGQGNYLFSGLPVPAGEVVGVYNHPITNAGLLVNNEYLTCNEEVAPGYYNISVTYSTSN